MAWGLIRAHVATVPFENSGSLLQRLAAGTGPVPPLDSEALLAAWEARSAGGVCFEHTEMFGRLLGALGYPILPIAGEISFPGRSRRSSWTWAARAGSSMSVTSSHETGPKPGWGFCFPRRKSRFTEEQIAYALRQAEARTSVTQLCRKMGISEQTFNVWKRRFAGMGVAALKKVKQLEDEHRRLKSLVADLARQGT
jgi:putative transposase